MPPIAGASLLLAEHLHELATRHPFAEGLTLELADNWVEDDAHGGPRGLLDEACLVRRSAP